MRSRTRQEKRLQAAQDTVAAQRSERQEQKSLGAQSNLQRITPVAKVRAKKEREELTDDAAAPRRIARPGKPLKR